MKFLQCVAQNPIFSLPDLPIKSSFNFPKMTQAPTRIESCFLIWPYHIVHAFISSAKIPWNYCLGSRMILQALPLNRTSNASWYFVIGRLCDMTGVTSTFFSAISLSHSCQVWKILRPCTVRRVSDLNTGTYQG